MDYIRKLPLLMALTGAIITGLVGNANRVPDKQNMLKMVILMIVFYIVGCFIKGTITNIIETNLKRAIEKEMERKKIEEGKRREESLAKKYKSKGQILDLAADDQMDLGNMDEDFNALPVADFIKKELNQ